MPALRYSLSALAGMSMALTLLWLMQLLVTSPADKLPTAESMRLIEFVRLRREETLQLKQRPPPPPPESAAPPPRPRINLQAQTRPVQPQLLDMSMNLDLPLNFGGGPSLGPQLASQADSGFVPLTRQPPRYPYKAARRGIEGWVRVEFDVTETGSVENVVVIESDPPGTFDQAATRAVYRWKFRPRIIDGKPTAGKAVQVVEFKLNK